MTQRALGHLAFLEVRNYGGVLAAAYPCVKVRTTCQPPLDVCDFLPRLTSERLASYDNHQSCSRTMEIPRSPMLYSRQWVACENKAHNHR